MGLIDIGLIVCYIAAFVAAGAAIVLPLINALKNPAGLLKSLIFVVVALVVFGIAYAISDSARSVSAISMGVSETGVKLIGAGLITFYIALVVAALGLIYSEVSKSFK